MSTDFYADSRGRCVSSDEVTPLRTRRVTRVLGLRQPTLIVLARDDDDDFTPPSAAALAIPVTQYNEARAA